MGAFLRFNTTFHRRPQCHENISLVEDQQISKFEDIGSFFFFHCQKREIIFFPIIYSIKCNISIKLQRKEKRAQFLQMENKKIKTTSTPTIGA